MKRALSFLILLIVSLFLVSYSSIKVSADLSKEVSSFYFRLTNDYGYTGFLFEGVQSKINLGISSTDNGGKDQVWFYSSGEYEPCFIKWVNNEPVKLGTENVSLIADDETHYGIFFALYTHVEGDYFSNDLHLYYKEYFKEYSTFDYDISLINNSYYKIENESQRVLVYLDLGCAEKATTITINMDGGFLLHDHLVDNKIKIKRNSKLTDLGNPEKDKMIFEGWYSDSEFKTKYNFNNPFYDETATLYANYVDAKKIEEVSVTFDMINLGETIIFDSKNMTLSPQLKFNMGSEDYQIFQTAEGLDMVWYDYNTGIIMNDVTFESNKEYGILFDLVASDGSYFDDNVQVTVNGFTVEGTVTMNKKEINKVKLLRDNEIVQIAYSFIPHTISLDTQAGILKKELFSSLLTEGTQLTLNKIDKGTITPPTGKVFDAYLINETRYEIGSTYTLTEDTNIKLLWKDKPVYKLDIVSKESYTPSIDKAATFTMDMDYTLFTGNVYIDNTLIDSSQYTATSGSTIITLSESYLNSLAIGNHEIKVEFEEGYAVTSFEILENDISEDPTDVTPTEPSNPNVLVIVFIIVGILLVLIGIVIVIIVIKKKTKKNINK